MDDKVFRKLQLQKAKETLNLGLKTMSWREFLIGELDNENKIQNAKRL